MSYDVWLVADLGGPEPVDIGLLEANYTYNVYPMFKKAGDCSPNDWDGMSAANIGPKCRAMIAAFDAEPDAYRALNPENGWGDFDGARNFLCKIAEACELAPRATVRVC